MKSLVFIVALHVLLVSCEPHKTIIVKNCYIGMTIEEYGKHFNAGYALRTSSSTFVGKLNPVFSGERLTSLSIRMDDVCDFDTAYTVYELGNDLTEKYGSPIEKKETIWAGGCSKDLTWKKGPLEVRYSYHYNQVPGTSGLLYTGAANLAYNGNLDVGF